VIILAGMHLNPGQSLTVVIIMAGTPVQLEVSALPVLERIRLVEATCHPPSILPLRLNRIIRNF
jgi:hypothetical protein